MDFSVTDQAKRCLLEIHISFNYQLLRDFLFTRSGIWRYFYLIFSSLLFLNLFCGLQAVLPHFFPEIPWYPAVLFLAFLCSRHSFLWSLIMVIPGGIMLDAAQFQNLGSNVILLGSSVFAVALLDKTGPAEKHPLLADILAGGTAAAAFVLCHLLLFAGGLTVAQRLALLPRFLLLALPVNALAAGPALFVSLDFLERIFSKQKPAGPG